MTLNFFGCPVGISEGECVKERCQASKLYFGIGNMSFIYVKRERLSRVLTQLWVVYMIDHFQQPQKCGLKRIITRKNYCRICSYGIFWHALDSQLLPVLQWRYWYNSAGGEITNVPSHSCQQLRASPYQTEIIFTGRNVVGGKRHQSIYQLY